MGKGKRDADAYESDGGFISNDDGGVVPKSKKSKTASSAGSKGGKKYFELSTGKTPRRVEISEFKGNRLVNIREFYEKDGEYLPGKKGISLTVEQYKALLAAIPKLNAQLGISVDGVADDEDEEDEEDEEEDEEQEKPKKKARVKREKSNIDATSDEEE